MPWAGGWDKLKAMSHLKENGIVVGSVIGGGDPPAGNSHREIPSEGNIDVGAAKRCLECGNFAHIFYMEAVAEEEFLKFRAAGIFPGPYRVLWALESTARMSPDERSSEYWRSFTSHGGSTWRHMSRYMLATTSRAPQLKITAVQSRWQR